MECTLAADTVGFHSWHCFASLQTKLYASLNYKGPSIAKEMSIPCFWFNFFWWYFIFTKSLIALAFPSLQVPPWHGESRCQEIWACWGPGNLWRGLLRISTNTRQKNCTCSRFWMQSHSSNGLVLQQHCAKTNELQPVWHQQTDSISVQVMYSQVWKVHNLDMGRHSFEFSYSRAWWNSLSASCFSCYVSAPISGAMFSSCALAAL